MSRNSYGFKEDQIPSWAVYGEVDEQSGEWTGLFFRKKEDYVKRDGMMLEQVQENEVKGRERVIRETEESLLDELLQATTKNN